MVLVRDPWIRIVCASRIPTRPYRHSQPEFRDDSWLLGNQPLRLQLFVVSWVPRPSCNARTPSVREPRAQGKAVPGNPVKRVMDEVLGAPEGVRPSSVLGRTPISKYPAQARGGTGAQKPGTCPWVPFEGGAA